MKNINNELTITNHNGAYVADSRDVAVMVGKTHCDLLKDIRRYAQILEREREISFSECFIEKIYTVKGNKRTYPYFLVTKKGCEMVANKLTGKKGVLFTATYVNKFNEMEEVIIQPHPQFMLPQNYVEALEALSH